ncbi:UNVERIFIED_CONTAM: hypothetical protein GTU68_000037 [Idotea baltica]|nr:hypothetical protein [Idotea baltica]
MAREVDAGDVTVTTDADVIALADRIVLPGDGAFPACMTALKGICVGMQLMASMGREYEDTKGINWIAGEVTRISPTDETLKVPHMGWNNLVLNTPHPVFDGIKTGDHTYFVHSYHMAVKDPAQRLAHVEYASEVTAVIGRDNMVGMQFHPEKSQATGLRMISNFLRWAP